MRFLKNIFKKKDATIETNADFWNWFMINERVFHTIVKNGEHIVPDFFDPLNDKFDELGENVQYLAGMLDEDTAELIITADGIIKQIPFVEELVRCAPKISNWKFTAHKPSRDIANAAISMNGIEFNGETLYFYAIEHKKFPDKIDLVIVHSDFNVENKSMFLNGVYMFLDIFLGELNVITSIDNINVASKRNFDQDLIPIHKLKDFLIWREKEFIEKYSEIHHASENDEYKELELALMNGQPIIAVVNSTLLEWESKASHPWILNIEITYDGQNNNGFPDNSTFERMNDFESDVAKQFEHFKDCLNVGRETGGNQRNIYFACKEFRKPSIALRNLIKTSSYKLAIDYRIGKDKYWQLFEEYQWHR